MSELFNQLKSGNPKKPTTHVGYFDRGVVVHGWVVGQNPFNSKECLFLTSSGEVTIFCMDAVREKKPKPKKEIHLTEAMDVAIFKDLIDKLANLTPATRDRNPGIGPGMLNTLIDYAKKLEKATA